MIGRRWFVLGASAISIAAAVAVGVEGLAVANAGQTNNRGGNRVGIVRGSSAPSALTVHHYSLAASAFAPDSLHPTASDYFNQWDPTTLSDASGGGRCFNAGVVLPDGAKITAVTFYYTEGSNIMYFELNRQDLVDHTYLDLASFNTATTGTPFYTSTVLGLTANNIFHTNDAYSFGVCPAGTTTFSGATISYTG
jgi:hypothetical protein